MNKILCNVEKVKTSFQDRKITIIHAYVDLENWGSIDALGMVMDTYDEELKSRVGTSYGGEVLRQLLDFFGVDDLSEVKNYKCYVLTDKDNIHSSSDILGFEQLGCHHQKDNRKQFLKSQILEQHNEKAKSW